MLVGKGNAGGSAVSIARMILDELASSFATIDAGSSTSTTPLTFDGGNSSSTYTDAQTLTGGAST